MSLLDKRFRTPGWYYHSLRYQLERALLFHGADNALLALGTSSGIINWRARQPAVVGQEMVADG